MWLSNLGKFRRVLVFDAEKVCVSERFSLIRRRKKSVQLCPQETTHPIFQFHQIVQFHVKEIVHLPRFLSWRDSEFLIPHHGKGQKRLSVHGYKSIRNFWSPGSGNRYRKQLQDRTSCLLLIPQGFRISYPPSRQWTKMAICSCLSKYSEFLISQAT